MSDRVPDSDEVAQREAHGLPVQPAPQATGLPSAHDLLCAVIERRKAFGLDKYQTILTPWNGRDQLSDGLDELADLGVYLVCAIEERRAVNEGPVFTDRGALTVRGLLQALLTDPTRFDLPIEVACGGIDGCAGLAQVVAAEHATGLVPIPVRLEDRDD